MNKTDFSRTLAEVNNISYKQAEEEVNRVLGHIHNTVAGLKDGEVLNLTGLAKFKVDATKARNGRNPQTNEPMEIPASRTVRISAGSTLKNAVKA